MSCFAGRMNEYELISLDRFNGENLQSTVYFLSHLHEDHTVGLGGKLLFQRLKSKKGIFLYCSEVTELLLQASVKYKHLAPYIKSININTPTILEIPDPLFDEKEKVTVTFLPAFHCPGSVMCLFEGHEGTVIYTGDFRWEHFHIEQMHHLRSAESCSVKPVKSLYVDTTFCTPNNLYFPIRQQCIDAVYCLIREWISQSAQHVVYISLRAQYGYEPLLNAVASRLNQKVHVSKHKAEVYDNIEQSHGNFTADGTTTQIHACDKQVKVNLDGEMVSCRQTHDADKVLVILPTTRYFTQFQHLTLDKIIKRINSNFYRACYSFHPSYTEIKDLLSYLKPDKVSPNVKPRKDSTLATTQHRLNTMLKECLTSGSGDITQAESQEEVKQLGTFKTRKGRAALKRKATVSISDSESLDFGTPTKTKTYTSQSQDSGLSSSKRGRGRGSGKEKVATESSSQSVPSTRRSSRRLAATASTAGDTDSQQVTPKKVQRSESPDLFVSPVKHETSDVSDIHSSYAGSHRSDIELNLTQSSQPSLEFRSRTQTKNMKNIEMMMMTTFIDADELMNFAATLGIQDSPTVRFLLFQLRNPQYGNQFVNEQLNMSLQILGAGVENGDPLSPVVQSGYGEEPQQGPSHRYDLAPTRKLDKTIGKKSERTYAKNAAVDKSYTDSENINQVEIISSGEAEKLETNAKLEDEMSVDNDEVNVKRTKQEKKSEVSDDKTCEGNGEGKEMIEVESSQEWLSVSKAIATKAPDLTSRKRKKRKNHDASLKKKKSKNDKEKASKSASKVGSSKDSETALYEELDNDESNLGQLDGLSEKEKEDRAEVRRHAMGFVCETDSDSDTIPPSPTGSVLYDDYIELSSDSDKEDDQNTGHKENNFSSTGWLTSRKQC